MIRFHWLSGDVNYLSYGGKWISNRQYSGEFHFWFIVELINLEDAVGEAEAKQTGGKYNLSLAVVAPSQCPEDKLREAVRIRWDETSSLNLDRLSDTQKAEILHEYGIRAIIFDKTGKNFKSLFKEARNKAREAEFLFGFAMDRSQNAIGSTGWDFLRGDILAGIRRYPDSPEKSLMRKIENGCREVVHEPQ